MNTDKQQDTPPSWPVRMGGKLRTIGLDGFLLGIMAAILIAFLYPQLGAEDGPLPIGQLTTYGVSLIFFFYGLRLSPIKLKAGLKDWRLHLVVQAGTFVLFPVVVYAAYLLLPTFDNPMLWVGIFYVAALPSTVSSSVVMVSIASGNVPSAIFNASISSLIGVFMTPFWMSLFMSTSASGEMDLTQIILKLLLQVILPVTIGILLHHRFGHWAEKHKTRLKLFDQSIILLIVYSSFCDSFAQNLFDTMSTWHLVLLGFSMVTLFFIVFGLLQWLSKLLGFNRENTITAVFCGSKKSLVHGTVMSKVIFTGMTSLGIILLPLMLYHALQLIIASVMAQRLSRQHVAEITKL